MKTGSQTTTRLTRGEQNARWNLQGDDVMALCNPPDNPNRPKGLKNPYQWVLPIADFDKLWAAIRRAVKPYKKQLQCRYLHAKPAARGARLEVFLSAAAKPFELDKHGASKAMSQTDWNTLIERLDNVLAKYLPDSAMFADDWTREQQFQLRFQTHVAYKELLK